MNTPALDNFLKRDRSGRSLLYVVVGILVVLTLQYWRLSTAFETRLRFILYDPSGTLLITQEQDFTDAKALHAGQAELAVQALFNRSPAGFDSEDRLRRLYDKWMYQKAKKMAESEALEFEAKSIHQKVEIRETKIQKLQGREVKVVVYGQLLRVGSFEGQPSVEVLDLEMRMRFAENPSFVENARYPTVLTEFEVQTTPQP